MYFNFKVKDMEGLLVPHKNVFYSESPGDGYYSLECESFPQYFFVVKDGHGKARWDSNIFIGFESFPTVTFNPDCYADGLDPFMPFDVAKSDVFKRVRRRSILSSEVGALIPASVELKYLRKFALKVIEFHPELAETEEGQAITMLSDSINSKISEHPAKADLQDLSF